MKNIFIRAGMSPFESFPPHKIILDNAIGTNLGNFLYLNGILRNITAVDTVVTPTYYQRQFTDADIDRINETQDVFIIPLADAFRSNFVGELRGLTHLVRGLKIPCVVIGVGLRAPYESDFSEPFPFDEDVKDFVRAVLEKSAMVGVRGQITADYLSHLGFREGTDHMVIGCPSMYTNGDTLSIRTPELTEDSLVCINSSPTTPDNVQNFLYRLTAEFPNWRFVPQVRSELRILYTGIPYTVKTNAHYPTKLTDEAYRDGRSQFFLNTTTWIEYLSRAELSVGSRLHGNIAATLGGTPSILFTKDARTRELADYHHLTQCPAAQVDEATTLRELVEKADFQQPCPYQKENFARFLSFLERNEIPHIYKDGKAPEVIPYEERLKQTTMLPSITSVTACSMEEVSKRFDTFFPIYDKQMRELKAQIAASQKQTATLKEKKNTFKEKVSMLEKENAALRSEVAKLSSIPPSLLWRIKNKVKRWMTAGR